MPLRRTSSTSTQTPQTSPERSRSSQADRKVPIQHPQPSFAIRLTPRSGIGYGFLHTILAHNISKVFVLSVSREVVEGAKKSITETLGADFANRTEWIECDIADWTAVKDVAEHIKKSTSRLDILLNNAGRGIMSYALTESGVDRHMAVNHIGHAVLTSHLLPLLKSTSESHGPVRIVFQSSNAHQGAPSDVKFASLDELNQDLGPNGQYGRSKLAVLLYARYLAKHLTQGKYPGILSNATHPGFVSTKQSKVDIHEPYPILGYGLSVFMEPFKKSQWQGCVPAVYAATVTEKSGEYVCPPKVVEEGTAMSNDEALGEQLMKLTREIVEEKTGAKEKGCPLTFY